MHQHSANLEKKIMLMDANDASLSNQEQSEQFYSTDEEEFEG